MNELYARAQKYTEAEDAVTEAEAHRAEVIAEENAKVAAAKAAAYKAREELLGYVG